MTDMKRNYIDGPFGQIHIYQWGDDEKKPALVCLPPAPFSSNAYATIAPLLATKRKVIAVDYPGYGNSDACPHTPMISDYAQAVAAVIADFVHSSGQHHSCDLVGFHTGCLVAAETSLQFAHQVRKLILVDVPFFSTEKQAQLLPVMAKAVEIEQDLEMLRKPWDFCISKKLEHMSLERAYDIFVDHIATGKNTNAAFNAAFQYPCEERFAQITHPTDIIASSAGGLYDSTLAAAKAIEHSALVEHTEITAAVLEKGAPTIANTILGNYLSE